MTRRMTTGEAQQHFGDVVSRAYDKSEPTIVERHGTPVAVVISPAQYERFRDRATREMFDTIREVHGRTRDADPDELEAEIAQAVAEV